LRTGQWTAALDAYQRADTVQSEIINPSVGRALALLATDRVAECLQAVSEALPSADPVARAELQLIEGEAKLASTADPSEGERIIRKALATGLLPAADHAYAEALLAPDVPAARKLLTTVIELSGYHQRAHRRLLSVEFIMGDFVAATTHLRAMQMLFPEDWTPVAIAMMIDVANHERSGDASKAVYDMFADKYGSHRCQLLQAEFDLMMTIIDVATWAALRDDGSNLGVEQRILKAYRERLRQMYDTVQEGQTSEGMISVGFARPVLPCVYRALRQFENATDAELEGRHEETREYLTAATTAYPESLLLYYKGFLWTTMVARTFSTTPDISPEAVATQTEYFWEAIKT
ncbi:MAG: hypothetical protein KDB23_33010, partial [Planctomycetales bacterium]|nr:hypothetical protein [Planctomycetales bacterium]